MAKSKDPLFLIYAFAIFWTMCVSNGLSFTRYVPSSLSHVVNFSIPMLYLFVSRKDTGRKNGICCIYAVIIGLLALYATMITSFFSILAQLTFILGTCSVLLLPYRQKKQLLDFLTNGVVAILCVSIPFWFLFLMGISLPHGAAFEHENGFHELIDYYVFFISAKPTLSLIQRYQSVFLEPGQLASVSVLLFFANGANLRKWKSWVFLLATVLSFSLVGYGLVFGGLLLNSIMSSRKGRFLKVALFVTIFGGITIVTIRMANEDNPLYTLIFQRLEYDEEKGIAGNNRTSDDFDAAFEKYFRTGDKWLGIGREMEYGNNWAMNSSGVRKYIVYNGIIGFAILMLFMLVLLKQHFNYKTFILFVVAVVAFLVRDMLRTQFWLFIVILGFYLQGPLPKRKRRKVRVNHLNGPADNRIGQGLDICETRPVV